MPRFSKLLMPVEMLAVAGLAACVGVPAQQMFDAEQAVRAARKAGAEQYSPALLVEAQAHLKVAKTNLHTGDYRAARDEAELARDRAMDARRAAEEATGILKR